MNKFNDKIRAGIKKVLDCDSSMIDHVEKIVFGGADKEPKWIVFWEVPPAKPQKTKIYMVVNKEYDTVIGEVRWYGPFRKYSFFPCANMVFESTCMQDITNFMDGLMEERKMAKEDELTKENVKEVLRDKKYELTREEQFGIVCQETGETEDGIPVVTPVRNSIKSAIGEILTKEQSPGLLKILQTQPAEEIPASLEALIEKMSEIWEGSFDPYKCEIDVSFGWAGKDDDKYWAEAYTIHGEPTMTTGRAGMKMFLEHGAPITKLTINGKDCTDRIEEFRQFILVNDKPFNV